MKNSGPIGTFDEYRCRIIFVRNFVTPGGFVFNVFLVDRYDILTTANLPTYRSTFSIIGPQSGPDHCLP